MAGKVIDIDRGYKDLSDRLEALGGGIEVGIHASENDEHEDGEATIAEIAFWNEFGTEDGHVPERSFFRSTMDENQAKYAKLVTNMIKGALKGSVKVHQGMKQIAMVMESDIRNKVRNLKTPPNAPATIARKGSSNPLIDTGTMRRSIRGKVVK